MYNLLVRKSDTTLVLKKVTKTTKLDTNYEDEPKKFNDIYWMCAKREPLKQKALEFKAEWITDTEELLQKLNDLEI
ncbi:hypothetical protein [Marinilactibacillus kalidii]|uniref:hypothetical protein n=1 Tax=Marinilactibacillus kalidii TaxID=2820274 RepID=UPI001ABE5E3A|nr:hypothetical protein [Marinilactibacillus kalidii]